MRGTGRFFEDQPSDMLEFMQRAAIPRALLLRLDFVSGSQYVADWSVPVVDANNQTWQPFKGLVSIADVAGGASTAQGVDFVLGVPWEFLGEAEKSLEGVGTIMEKVGDRSDYANRGCALFVQHFDPDNLDQYGRMRAKGVPVALDVLKMKSVSARFGRRGAGLVLRAQSIMEGTQRPLYGYLTDRDQKARYPDDNGLRYVQEVAYSNQTWERVS